MSNTKATQQMLSGIPAGGKNYFSLSGANGDFANGSVLPWTTFATTLSNGVPTTFTTGGTGGMTIAINSTTPLGDSLYDLILTKPASNVVGTGMISGVLTLNKEDKFSTMLGYFSYLASNTNFDSSGTGTQSLEVWILDVTATAALGYNVWIQPGNYRGMTGGPKLSFNWQSGNVVNNQYRIAIFTAQTSALAYAVEFASFSLAPLFSQQGITAASSIVTVYGGATTSTGMGSTNTSCRRFLNLDLNLGTAIVYTDSATLGAYWTIKEAGLYQMEYGDVMGTGTGVICITRNSQAVVGISGVQTYQIGPSALILANNQGSTNATYYLQAGDIIRAQDANNVARSAAVTTRDCWFSISKINLQTGVGDGVVQSFEAGILSSTTITAGSPLILTTLSYDTTGGAYNTSTGGFTARSAGLHDVFFCMYTPSIACFLYILVNGAPYLGSVNTAFIMTASTSTPTSGSRQIMLKVGDVVQIASNQNATAGTTAATYFSVTRVTGGVTINPNTPVDATVVKAKFGCNPTTGLSTTANTDIVWPYKEFDTASLYNNSTGILKVPSPGYYDFIASGLYFSAGGADYIGVWVNGTYRGYLIQQVTSTGVVESGCNSFYLLPTDSVTFRTNNNMTLGTGAGSYYSFAITVTKNTGGVNFNSPSMPTVTSLLSGSGTYTPPPLARYLRVRMVGGGGGGANCNTYVGGGGGSGAYLEFYVYSPSSSYAYAVGGGGAAATNGSNTTFNGNTAGGGTAGSNGGGQGGPGGTATFVNGTKITALNGGGGASLGNYGSVGTAGPAGGASAFGGAGYGSSGTNSTGGAGQPNTGGGGAAGAASSGAGGAGGSGAILIEEFY